MRHHFCFAEGVRLVEETVPKTADPKGFQSSSLWPSANFHSRVKLAGEDGFEPSDGGSKDRCLTTWRLPSKGVNLILQEPPGLLFRNRSDDRIRNANVVRGCQDDLRAPHPR